MTPPCVSCGRDVPDFVRVCEHCGEPVVEQRLLPTFAESLQPNDPKEIHTAAIDDDDAQTGFDFTPADHIEDAVAVETFEPMATSFDDLPGEMMADDDAEHVFDEAHAFAAEFSAPQFDADFESSYVPVAEEPEPAFESRVSEAELDAFMNGASLDDASPETQKNAALEDTAPMLMQEAAAPASELSLTGLAVPAPESSTPAQNEAAPHAPGVLFGAEAAKPAGRSRRREFALATAVIGIGGVLTFAAMRGGNGDTQPNVDSLTANAPSAETAASASPTPRPAPAAPAPAAPEVETPTAPAPDPAPAPATPAASAGGRWNAGNAAWSGASKRAVAFELEANNLVSIWMRSVKPTLVVRCTNGRLEAFVYTASAARIEPGTDDHTVRYSFDSMPETVQRWRDSEEHDALFAPDADSIVRRLLDASQFRFVFTPHNAEPASAHFSVAGLRPLIEGAQRHCRVK